jgi:type IX secretion system PorP/SprF family membrane protein
MKTLLHNLLIVLLLIGMKSKIISQDIEFSQFYATKNYLNPAFTGLTADQSFSSTYRNQWPGIENAYNTHFISYDKKLKKQDAGIGINYINDVAGEGSLTRQSLALQFSKQIRFRKNLFGSFGIKTSYNINSIIWDNLTWGDMIDARKGFVYSTNQPRGAARESFFDVGSGFILYSKKVFGGVAVDHLNQPSLGLLSIYDNPKLPIRYKLHGGAKFRLYESPNITEMYFAPQFIYTRQGNTQQLNIGAYFNYSFLTLGVWHRIKDSFVFLVGIEQNKYRVGYSYDLSANKLISHSGGAHELSLTINFKNQKHSTKKVKYKAISCPVFNY